MPSQIQTKYETKGKVLFCLWSSPVEEVEEESGLVCGGGVRFKDHDVDPMQYDVANYISIRFTNSVLFSLSL
jgi:hypothetical protein